MNEVRGGALWHAVASGVWIAWLLFMVLTPAPYGAVDRILEPIGLFMVGSACSLLCAAALGRAPVFERVVPAARWGSYASAALSCFAIALARTAPFGVGALHVVGALLCGVSCALFFVRADARLALAEPLAFVRSSVAAIACSLVMMLLVAWLVDLSSVMGVLGIVLGLLAVWAYAQQPGLEVSGDLRMAEPAAVRQEPYLFALVVASSFLLAYELNGTQKTLHFPHLSEGAMFCLGSVSGVALMAVVVLLAVLGVLAVAGSRRNFATIAAVAGVGLCVTFFFLNNRTPVLFLLLFPFGAVVCMASVFGLLLMGRNSIAAVRARLFGRAWGACVLGCLLGAGCAYAVLALRDRLSFYDAIFTWLPAVLVLSCVVIAALMLGRGERSGRWAEEGPAKDLSGDGGASCAMLAERFGLTPREEEVLGLLAQGRSAPAIADILSVQVSTVKSHVGQIYRKAGVNTRQELLDALYRGPER